MAQRKSKPIKLHPAALERIDNAALREALLDKLSVAEINELTRQTENAINRACWEAAAAATEEAYKRQFAIMLRVAHDRLGFRRKRLRRLWDWCLEYIHDIDAGLLTTAEMLQCLENEDGVKITWNVKI